MSFPCEDWMAAFDRSMGEYIGSTAEPSSKFESVGKMETRSVEGSIKDEDKKGFAAAYDYAQVRWNS
jgi:hypothetical protein